MFQLGDEGGGGNGDGTPDHRPKCVFCCIEAASVEAAIDAGWAPDFWRQDVDYEGPVCRECVLRFLEFNEEFGDYQMKAGASLPPDARELKPRDGA